MYSCTMYINTDPVLRVEQSNNMNYFNIAITIVAIVIIIEIVWYCVIPCVNAIISIAMKILIVISKWILKRTESFVEKFLMLPGNLRMIYLEWKYIQVWLTVKLTEIAASFSCVEDFPLLSLSNYHCHHKQNLKEWKIWNYKKLLRNWTIFNFS